MALGGHPYLPYPQAACREIEHHLHALAAAFPASFDATLSPFTHDDGRDVVLVNATATLPCAAGNNTEVSVWLVEAYPHVPPLVFMSLPPRPCGLNASDTTARPTFVDASGIVTAPYLRHWRWPDSDLVGLLQSLQALAALHPSPTAPRGASGHAGEATADRCLDDADHTACVARHRSQDDFQTTLRAMQEDKERLERELHRVTVNVDFLERKLSIDGADSSNSEATRPPLAGGDDAAEDAVDELDRALQAGHLPLCQYLKDLKNVARAQFLNWPVPP